MPILEKENLIFINVPVTTNGEMERLLDISNIEEQSKWYVYKNEHPLKWKKYISFSVVRNPFDRVVRNFQNARRNDSYWDSAISPTESRYEEKTLKDKSFRETVDLLDELEHGGWERQHNFVTDGNENIVVDKIIKYENLEEELDILFSKSLNPEPSKLKKKKSRERGYRVFYDRETKKKVEEKYKKDLELFDYSF